MGEFLAGFDRGLGRVMRWLSIVCLVLLLLVLAAVVFIRFVPVARLSWSDEVVEWAFAWMVFIGAAALWREGAHFRVEALQNRFQGRATGQVLGLIVELVSLVFLAAFAYYGWELTVKANDRSPILEWPRPLWYVCIPLAGVIMVGYSIRRIIRLAAGLLGGRAALEKELPAG